MEKYGVDEELPGDKLGSENPTCPDCGAPLVDKINFAFVVFKEACHDKFIVAPDEFI